MEKREKNLYGNTKTGLGRILRITPPSSLGVRLEVFVRKIQFSCLDIDTTSTCLPLHHTVKRDKQVSKEKRVECNVFTYFPTVPKICRECEVEEDQGAPKRQNRCVAPAHCPLNHWLAFRKRVRTTIFWYYIVYAQSPCAFRHAISLIWRYLRQKS